MRLKIVYFFLIVSLLGFSDAVYLTVLHYQGRSPACSIVIGCGQVTGSKFALIMGVPVALLGAIYYLIILVLSLLYLDTENKKFLRLLSTLTAAGLFASLYFIFLQLFVIKYICLYCMLSATTSTLLFIGGMTYLRNEKQPAPNPASLV